MSTNGFNMNNTNITPIAYGNCNGSVLTYGYNCTLTRDNANLGFFVITITTPPPNGRLFFVGTATYYAPDGLCSTICVSSVTSTTIQVVTFTNTNNRQHSAFTFVVYGN